MTKAIQVEFIRFLSSAAQAHVVYVNGEQVGCIYKQRSTWTVSFHRDFVDCYDVTGLTYGQAKANARQRIREVLGY